MLKWILILFSFVLVGCQQENTSNFHLEAVHSSEARQNQENSRYYIYPEDDLILVEEFENTMNFNYDLNEYELNHYDFTEDALILEYNNTALTFEKLSDSVYTSEAGTWYSFDLETDENETDEEPEIEDSDQMRGSRANPYQIGETARTNILYLDDDLNKHSGVIKITIGTSMIGQEAEEYVLDRGEHNKAAPDDLQWFVADVTLSFVEGADHTPYAVNLPFRVYDGKSLIAQYGEHVAVLDNGIEGTTLFPQQTAKGKVAFWIPEGDLSDVTFELETGRENIWFGFSEPL